MRGDDGCPFSHRTYRDVVSGFVDSSSVVHDDTATRQLWAFNSHFKPFFTNSPLGSGRWLAVLPVPLLPNTWDALHSPHFHSALTAVMRGPHQSSGSGNSVEVGMPTVTVLMGSARANMPRVWGSVLLQGRRRQVERGREAFVELMERGYYKSGNTRQLLDVQEEMARRYGSESRAASVSEQPAPLSPAAPERKAATTAARSISRADSPPTLPHASCC